MSDFETFLIPGPECSAFLTSIAGFLDISSRAFGCDHLSVVRRASTGQLIGTLDLTTVEKQLYLSQEQIEYPVGNGNVVCNYIAAENAPPEDRPLASTAVKALGSIASKIPLDLAISNVNAFNLDHISVVAPELTISCAGRLSAFNTFISEHEPRYDGAGTPHLVTKYANHHNDPIEVRLYFNEYHGDSG